MRRKTLDRYKEPDQFSHLRKKIKCPHCFNEKSWLCGEGFYVSSPVQEITQVCHGCMKRLGISDGKRLKVKMPGITPWGQKEAVCQ